MNNLLLSINDKLTNGWVFEGSVLVYVLLYAAFSALLVFGLLKMVPKRYLVKESGKSQYIGIYVFFLSVCVFFPILGLFFSGVLIYLIKTQKSAVAEFAFNEAKYPLFRKEKFDFGRRYDSGGAFALAMNKKSDLPVRIRSLINLNALSSRQAQKINSILIQEKMDDIRLYSYVLSEKKRNSINKSIQILLSLKKHTKDPRKLAKINKWLAEAHWEYIYFGLFDKITEDKIKEMISEFANESLSYSKNASLYRLLGRLALHDDKLTEAKKYFEKSEQVSGDYFFALPFLLEIAYREKDYKLMKAYLEKEDPYDDNIVIKNAKQFWCHSHDSQ